LCSNELTPNLIEPSLPLGVCSFLVVIVTSEALIVGANHSVLISISLVVLLLVATISVVPSFQVYVISTL
jgi:hypothetical protein